MVLDVYFSSMTVFQIKRLVDETKMTVDVNRKTQLTTNRKKMQAIKEGFSQIRPILSKPHSLKMLLACTIFFFVMMR